MFIFKAIWQQHVNYHAKAKEREANKDPLAGLKFIGFLVNCVIFVAILKLIF